MKHKHADFIHAWADGAKIETRLSDGNWYEISLPNWGSWDSEFRIKPEPKPDVYVFLKFNTMYGNISRGLGVSDSNIRVTIDGETGQLKASEVLE